MNRPGSDEYDAYYQGYMDLAEDDPYRQLVAQIDRINGYSLLEEEAGERPAPGEWSIKEILLHLCDFERMFAYRALRFSRGDATPVEAFEQDPYVEASNANATALDSLLNEFGSLRDASMRLFMWMRPEMLERRGVAGGNEVSVRALLFIIAGHCEWHLRDMERMVLRSA